MHTMTIRAFGLVLLLTTPVLTWAQAPDAETARLEVLALCQAMPYNCPKGAAQTTPEDLRANQARTMVGATPPPVMEAPCLALIPAVRVIRDKEKWHVPLTTVDIREWQTWTRDSSPWHARLEERASAPMYRSTVDCVTTSTSGRAIPTLTSTCTLY